MLCTQLLEAVRYLHEDANVIHNDFKCSNVIVCDSVIEPMVPSTSAQDTCNVQIVVIDFGKVTTVENGKTYHLNSIEKLDYLHRYPHIAQEVIEGITKQTVRSDIYSIGGILHKVLDLGTVIQNQVKNLLVVQHKCQWELQMKRKFEGREPNISGYHLAIIIDELALRDWWLPTSLPHR